MKTKFYIFMIVVFGFLIMPNANFACGTKSEKSCCSKEQSNKGGCCKKKSKDKTCNGKCGKSTCTVQTISFGAVLPKFEDLNNNNFVLSLDKKQFFDKKTNISSGFYNIWLPPVIS